MSQNLLSRGASGDRSTCSSFPDTSRAIANRVVSPAATQNLDDDLVQLRSCISPASPTPAHDDQDIVFATCFVGLFLSLGIMAFALVPGFRFVAVQFLRLLLGCVAPQCF